MGRCGEKGSRPSSAPWSARQAAPPLTVTNPSGGSACGRASQNVTPDGATQMARTAGGAEQSCSDQPSRQLAASNECRAGTPAKRFTRAAASTAPSDSAPPRSRAPGSRAARRRLLVRRASAAHAREPSPRATNSGRWSGSFRCGAGAARLPPRSASAASSVRYRRQPARMSSGSTNRVPPPMSRPRLIAARAVQSAPSASRSSAMLQSVSPGCTAYVASVDGTGGVIEVVVWRPVSTPVPWPALVDGALAPAPDESKRGAPMVVSANTPMAIRAAIRSMTDVLRRASTPP